MRFLSYLKEQVKYISIKDAPDWVKEILGKAKYDLEVIVGSDVSTGGNWHDYNVMRVYLYQGGRVSVQSAAGGPSINDTERERKVKDGFNVKLTPDKMVLITNSYPKGARLYVHPNAMSKVFLEEPKQDITPEEYLALVATKSLKASYAGGKPREQECMKYGVNYETAKAQLISKGLLNKNGAINKHGKNAILAKFGGGIIDTWGASEKLGLKKNSRW